MIQLSKMTSLPETKRVKAKEDDTELVCTDPVAKFVGTINEKTFRELLKDVTTYGFDVEWANRFLLKVDIESQEIKFVFVQRDEKNKIDLIDAPGLAVETILEVEKAFWCSTQSIFLPNEEIENLSKDDTGGKMDIMIVHYKANYEPGATKDDGKYINLMHFLSTPK